MDQIRLFPEEEKIRIDNPNQHGIESYPGLKEKALELLDLLAAAQNLPQEIAVDFETNTVTVTYSIKDLEKKSLLKAVGYEEADMSNVVDLVNAYINGQISETHFSQMLDMEGASNEPDQAVKEFLKRLKEQEDDQD